jgi:hypothetical protein
VITTALVSLDSVGAFNPCNTSFYLISTLDGTLDYHTSHTHSHLTFSQPLSFLLICSSQLSDPHKQTVVGGGGCGDVGMEKDDGRRKDKHQHNFMYLIKLNGNKVQEY